MPQPTPAQKLQKLQGHMDVTKTLFEQDLNALATNPHALGVPANEVAMVGAFLTIGIWLCRWYVDRWQADIDRMSLEANQSVLHVPESGLVGMNGLPIATKKEA